MAIYIDSILNRYKWTDTTLTYSFPNSAAFFSETPPWNTRPDVFLVAPADFQVGVKYWLDQISSFTNLQFVPGSAQTATLCWALSSDPNVGSGANLPQNTNYAGDAYFSYLNY